MVKRSCDVLMLGGNEMGEGEITVLLAAIREGKKTAEEELLGLVYDELKRIAASLLRRERSGHILQTTALVHETYLKLMPGKLELKDRGHFFAVMAQAMRRVLVDQARQQQAQKRGGEYFLVELKGFEGMKDLRSDQVLQVDQALDKLGRMSPRQRIVVEMRFFAGFTEEEIAEFLDVNSRTIKRDWMMARAWLRGEMERQS